MNKLFNSQTFEKIIKSRFIYDQSFSIYGGCSGLFDIGPVGCAIQNNIVAEWRKHFVIKDLMQEVDCAIITPEIVLKNSGHLSKFSDLMVRDEKTNEPFRVDHLVIKNLEKRLSKAKNNEKYELTESLKKVQNSQLSPSEIDELIKRLNIKSPTTGNSLSNTKEFNLMFQTHIGPTGQIKSYLRPETTQGVFLNFKRIFKQNPQLPLKVAQIGKGFRNEISPKSGLIRQREFLMAEIAHFLHPSRKFEKYDKFDESMQNLQLTLFSEQMQKESEYAKNLKSISLKTAVENKIVQSETIAYYLGRVHQFAVRCGIDEKRIRFRQHMGTELAHYANECWDMECLTSYGWIECVGIADRCDYDLRQHSESGENFSVDKIKAPAELMEKIREYILTVPVLSDIDRENFTKNLAEEQFLGKIETIIQNDKVKELKLGNISITRNEVMKIFNETSVVLPHVIEPSFGIGRLMYTILEHNFLTRDTDNRTYFSFPYNIAPYKCVILPLNDTDKRYEPLTNRLSEILSDSDIQHIIDDRSGSIGKRYSRSDEIGIKYAITLDYETLEDSSTVTVRERDSMKQIRVKIDDIASVLKKLSLKKLTIE